MPTNREGYIKAYYERERYKIICYLGAHCARCGKEYKKSMNGSFHIHHINPLHCGGGRGRLNRLTEWKREIRENGDKNLMLLCAECHEAEHR